MPLLLPIIENREALVSLAIALEIRARERYQVMATTSRGDGREDLACLFERLEQEEGSHIDQLLDLAGPEGFNPELIEKDLKDILGDEINLPSGYEYTSMTVYACLADAVRAEEKAFSYYAFLISETEDPEIRTLAERLAKEELEHAALLRKARRTAFRAAKRLEHQWPDVKEMVNLETFREASRASEAAYLQRHLDTLEKFGILREVLDLLQRCFTDVVLPKADGDRSDGTGHLLRDAVDDAQAAFEFYDAVASTSEKQDVMLAAQEMTEIALARIKLFSNALAREMPESS